jgi:hypothetical protein
MKGFIEFTTEKNETVYRIPNAWNTIGPDLFRWLIGVINEYAAGKMSLVELRVKYVCHVMGWNINKIHSDDGMANLYFLSDKVSFLFEIKYDDKVLMSLLPEEIRIAKTVPPDRLPIHLKRYLSKYEFKYVLKDCFCCQLIPTITVGDATYHGYDINDEFGMLTCSLTALQYIEAQQIVNGDNFEEMLPLLISILYYPGEYDSEKAKKLAFSFVEVPVDLKWAILFNFKCILNFIFTKTEFKLLTLSKLKESSTIVTGAIESMYNLCNDGIGDANSVERINVITYLTLLRKKLIESIKSMKAYGMKIDEIESESGMPVNIIEEIIK